MLQIVADTLMFGHRTYTDSFCAGYGVRAWGNDTTSGWQVSGGSGSGVGARLKLRKEYGATPLPNGKDCFRFP